MSGSSEGKTYIKAVDDTQFRFNLQVDAIQFYLM